MTIIEQLAQQGQSIGNNEDALRGRRDFSRGTFAGLLNDIVSRGTSLADSTLTAEDLFGEEIQQLNDNARQNANAVKQAISRSLLSGTGDVSGTAGTALLQNTQNLQSQIGDNQVRFTQLANQINQQERGRGLNLLQSGLAGQQNLLQFDQNLLDSIINRRILQDQAKRQRRANLIGGALQAAGSAAALLCWVAVELYGEGSKKTNTIRAFLYGNKDSSPAVNRFFNLYEKHGRQWAKQIRKDIPLRGKMNTLFDNIYKMATGD